MKFIETITQTVMPIILLCFSLMLAFSKSHLLDSFIVGAKDGMMNCVNLLPTLLLILCGVSMLFSSGAVDLLCRVFSPILSLFGIEEELLPAIVLRPFSGSGVTAVADKLFRDIGADSSSSKAVSLLMGSTDTIIYTLSVYFSAAKVKRTRYALPVSFIVYVFSIVFCNYTAQLFL